MPSDPVINIHALARNCAAGERRWRKAGIGAIRQALTPTPIKARASVNATKLRASANAAQPSTASSISARSTRRGPWRSSALPIGSCIAAKPKKYAPASRPRSP